MCINKKFSSILLFLFLATAYADQNRALNFAVQAGAIAGAAQACGLDVSEFTNRVNQSLAILADTTAQITEARETYLSTLSSAAQSQAQGTQFTCIQVSKDFNSLPLMQSDYEQAVLPQLRKSVNKTVTFLPTENNPNLPNPNINSPTMGGTPSATDTSAQGGIPNAPSVLATGGIPNVPVSDTPPPLITPSTTATSIPATPTQFVSPSTTPTSTTESTGIGYSPNAPITTAPTPSNASIPALPQFNTSPPQTQP